MNNFSNSQACKDFRRENLDDQNSATGFFNPYSEEFLKRSRSHDKSHIQSIPDLTEEKKLTQRSDSPPLWKNNKYEKLEISIERKIECGPPKKSGNIIKFRFLTTIIYSGF